MDNDGLVYSRDYDWAAELRARIPPLIARLRPTSQGADPRMARIVPYLQRFLDEASRPVPDRHALAGKLARDFSRVLSCDRKPIERAWREDLLDIINIVYLQPTAILYTPPRPRANELHDLALETARAAARKPAGAETRAAQVPWQGNAVAFNPLSRFQLPFLAPRQSGRKML